MARGLVGLGVSFDLVLTSRSCAPDCKCLRRGSIQPDIVAVSRWRQAARAQVVSADLKKHSRLRRESHCRHEPSMGSSPRA